MRRRRRSSLRKEKAIMLVSSALVLTALTTTGFYVRNMGNQEEEEQIIDFADLEEDISQEQVYDSNGQAEDADGLTSAGETGNDLTAADESVNSQTTAGEANLSDFADTGELDYDPNFTEANSDSVDNSERNVLGSTSGMETDAAEQTEMTDSGEQAAGETAEERAAANETAGIYEDELSVAASSDSVSGASEKEEDMDAMNSLPALDFTESEALVWPIAGNVLVNYSMDKTVYYATLQQYKYSPAIVISASVGEGIAAAADGKVTRIYTDREIGTAVVMDLGGGYELTYGQLTDLTVSEGNYVTCGEIIGKVAEPTKYYSVEGSNIYFKLTRDGQPVNPMSKLD